MWIVPFDALMPHGRKTHKKKEQKNCSTFIVSFAFRKYPFLVDDHKMSTTLTLFVLSIVDAIKYLWYSVWMSQSNAYMLRWYIFQWKIHVMAFSFHVPISLFHWVCFHTVCKHLNQTSENDFDTVKMVKLWMTQPYTNASDKLPSSQFHFCFFFSFLLHNGEPIRCRRINFRWNEGGFFVVKKCSKQLKTIHAKMRTNFMKTVRVKSSWMHSFWLLVPWKKKLKARMNQR